MNNERFRAPGLRRSSSGATKKFNAPRLCSATDDDGVVSSSSQEEDVKLGQNIPHLMVESEKSINEDSKSVSVRVPACPQCGHSCMRIPQTADAATNTEPPGVGLENESRKQPLVTESTPFFETSDPITTDVAGVIDSDLASPSEGFIVKQPDPPSIINQLSDTLYSPTQLANMMDGKQTK